MDMGETFATVALPPVNDSFDNSGAYAITIDVDGNVFNVSDIVTFDLATSPHLVKYIATDASSNSASCNIYITVLGQ